MIAIRIVLCFVVLVLCGCPLKSPATQGQKQSTDYEPRVHGPLRVVVLDDPEFATILEREWSAQSEYAIQFRNDSAAEMLSRWQVGSAKLDTDVVIFPSPLLGVLAENHLLRALPPELTSTSSELAIKGYNVADVFSTVARREMQWDRRQVAVSLGSPTPLLMVRTDLVPTIPSTWSEFRKVVDQLKTTLPQGVRPLSQPLGDGWAGRIFLSRAAPYLYQPSRVSGFFDYSSMQPRITIEPCVRALREMRADFDARDVALVPSTVFAEFMSGKAALGIGWPDNVDTESEPAPFPITIVELPGVTEEFDQRSGQWKPLPEIATVRRVTVVGHAGRMAAISRSAKDVSLAGIFLGWAGSAEQGSQLCPHSKSSAPFRKSHQASCKNWCDDRLSSTNIAQYGASLEAALSRSESFMSLRIPGQESYMKVLDGFVIRALQGEIEPAEALEKTSNAWEMITNELGREQQITAYRHSLGIDVE